MARDRGGRAAVLAGVLLFGLLVEASSTAPLDVPGRAVASGDAARAADGATPPPTGAASGGAAGAPVEVPEPARPSGLGVYGGLGAWFDVYDWSASYTGGVPAVGPESVAALAAEGVRTLYVQAARADGPPGVLEPERLGAIIGEAHARGLNVVGWYLPTLEDPAADLARLLAVADLPVDGIGVDIEARVVADPVERSRRLVQLSADLRAARPAAVLGAIVLPPVLLEEVNPAFWPGFPWAELAPSYDAWLPMSYWSTRRPGSGWEDAYAYTAANIDRLRALLGRPDLPVHTIGGVGGERGVTPDGVARMVQAAAERGVLGGSLYDARTTGPELWPVLRAFNG